MLWHDANLVSMVSTYHALEIGTQEQYDRLVHKPAIVLDYNKSMKGMDRKDQCLASQPVERHRNKVWYKKLFRRLLNATIFNCFVIFDSNKTNKLDHRRFRIELAEGLLQRHRKIDLKTEPRLLRRSVIKPTEPILPIQPAKPTRRPFVESNHFPMLTSAKKTRCWICTRAKRETRTRYKCEQCNTNLCIIGCFKEYHKAQ